MIKNPYAKLNQGLNLDSRSEIVLKKARAFGVDVFENPILAKELLSLDVKFENQDNIYDFFIWILQQEKQVQMSS